MGKEEILLNRIARIIVVDQKQRMKEEEELIFRFINFETG